MAKLVSCRACKVQISKTADVCPHCGHATSTSIALEAIKFIIVLFGIFFIGYQLMSPGLFGGLPS